MLMCECDKKVALRVNVAQPDESKHVIVTCGCWCAGLRKSKGAGILTHIWLWLFTVCCPLWIIIIFSPLLAGDLHNSKSNMYQIFKQYTVGLSTIFSVIYFIEFCVKFMHYTAPSKILN